MPSKYLLTSVNRRRYPAIVAETTATGFSSPETWADNRRSAVFLRPYASARLFYGRALVGRPSGLPVPTFRSANPVNGPLTPFSSGQRAFYPNVGGRTMLRRIPARPEQKSLPNSLTPHPLFAAAGRHAAELWLQSAPLSAGEF